MAYNVTITGATFNGSYSGASPDVFTPTGDNATANAATISADIAAGKSVTITDGSNSPGAQSGDITLSSSISGGTAASALSLQATGSSSASLSLQSSISTAGSLTLSAGGNVTQTAGAIAAAKLTGSASALALNASGNAIGTLGNFTTNVADLYLVDSIDLTISGQLSSFGAANVNDAGHQINLQGTLGATGAVTLTAGGIYLTGNATITTYGAITISSPIDDYAIGTHALTLSSGGTTTLGGSIGNGSPLASIEVYGAVAIAHDINTSGGQYFHNLASIAGGSSATLSSQTYIEFVGGLALGQGAQLTERAYSTTIGGLREYVGASGGSSDITAGQVQISGTLNISDSGSDLATGSTYTLITGGTNAVTGTFSGLAEGASVTSGDRSYTISYHGGTGRDVTLMALNDAPVVGGVSGVNSSYTEQATAVSVDSGLTLSDVDSANLVGATVSITGGLQAGDTLHFNAQNGITGSYSNGVLTLSGSASVANYQTALESVTFDNATNDNPTNSAANPTRSVSWQVDDGSGSNHLSNAPTSTITVTAVNEAPAISLQGNLDIVAAINGNFTVDVLLGNGLGGFSEHTAGIASGLFPNSVALGDLNGDGKPDIVTANGYSSNVSVLLGDGLGGFSASTTGLAGGGSPASITLGDLNGDGKLDIVTANGGTDNVSVLLGNGLGGFGASTIGTGSGSSPYSVALGDVNGDGKLDIVTADAGSDAVSVLLGNGSGGFTASTTGIGGGSTPISVALGDINGDGKLDIVTANQNSDNISVLLGNGSGGFNASTIGIGGGTSPFSVALGDVNGDGKLDIVTANHNSNNVSILLGDGHGGFSASTTGIGGGFQPWAVSLGDLNGDGKLDIVTANNGSILGRPEAVSVLLGNGSGGFSASTTGSQGDFPEGVALGDVNTAQVTDEDTALVLSTATHNAITLSDVDAGSGNETLSLSVSHGTLTLATEWNLVVSGGGTGSVSLTGTVSNINAALDGLSYLGDQNYNGSDSLVILANDGGNTGLGGAQTAHKIVPIVVNTVDDAPSGMDKSVTTLEDTAYTFPAADFGFSDIDGNSLLAIKITTLPAAGTLTENNIAVTAGQFVSVSDINAGLLKFTPAANANGRGYASFTFQVQDNGGTANGGVDTDQSPNTLTVNVTAVNDAPVVGASGGTTVATEQVPIVVDAAVTVTDIDSASLASATASITGGYHAGQDVLAFVNAGTTTYGNIAASFNSLTGVLTLSSAGATATVAQFQAALRAVTYTDTSDTPNTADRTIGFAANDGSDTGAVSSNTVSVAAVDDAPSFGAGTGKVVTSIGQSIDNATSVQVQPDGKIVVAGYSSNEFAVLRYNTDGSLDTSFGAGTGKVTTQFGTYFVNYFQTYNSYGESVQLQPDGKIVVAGYSSGTFYSKFAVARYNADGTPDTSFGANQPGPFGPNQDGTVITAVGASDSYGQSVQLQPDGKIVVSGYSATSDRSDGDFAVVRYDADGTPDATFGTSGQVTTSIASRMDVGRSVQVQPDGKIVVAGYSSNGSGYDFALVRYNTDGMLDPAFGTGGKVVLTVESGFGIGSSMELQPDGKIVVAGTGLLRFNSDGSLDTSFGSGGTALLPFANGNSLHIQPDGRIVVTGFSFNGFDGCDFSVARYNADGTRDGTFGTAGQVVTPIGSSDDYAYSVQVQPDGSIVVAGYTVVAAGYDTDFAVVRYHSDGSLDTRFGLVNTLDGTPTFTERGTPVVLDADVAIYDAELHAAGNYNGASLTLARDGGANAEDTFSAKSGGNLAALQEGTALKLSGLTIGTVTLDSAGKLILTFNTSATEARVNEAMQDIAYANSSHNPPGSVQIDWSFSDGNTGAQGTSGAQAAVGSTTVTMTAVNDAPAGADHTVTTLEDTAYTFAASDFGFTDIEGSSLLAVKITTLPAAGTLTDDNVAVTPGHFVSMSDINAGLLKFTPSANANGAGSASFTFQVQDDGGTDNGGVDTDPSPNTLTVDVTAVNDAPTATVPAGHYAATEQVALDLKNTGLSISDVDGGLGIETVTLSVGEGTLSVSAGGSGASVANSGTSSVTITGTTVQINALLNSAANSAVSYADNSDTPSASTALTLAINDNGNTGTGTAQNDSATATIDIAAINDAPTATAPAAHYSAIEQTPFDLKNTGLSVGDVDGGSGIETLTLSIGEGTLSGAAGTSGATIGGNGTASVTVTGTLAQINAFLNTDGTATLAYIDGSDTPSARTTLSLSINDGGNTGTGGSLTGTAASTIDITAVNDAPTATSPTAHYSATEQMALSLKNTGLSVGDVDGGSGIETLTLSLGEGTLSGATGTSGATIGGNGTVALTVTGTIAQINAFLNTDGTSALAYTDGSDTPSTSTTLSLSIDDGGNSGTGGAQTSGASSIIDITAMNDAPSVVTPVAGYNGTPGNPVTLSGITFADPDSEGGTEQVQFTVDNGALTATASSGVVLVSAGAMSVTATGTLADLNAFISGNHLSFTGSQASATLSIGVDDLGHTPAPAQTGNSSAAITIDQPPEAPADSDTTNANQVAENSVAGTYVGVTAHAIDPDAGDPVTYALTSNPGGFFQIDAQTGIVTTTAAGAAGIDYESGTHSYTIAVQASDGRTIGPAQSFTIAVTDVNDNAPVITSGATGSESENTGASNVVYQTAVADPDTVGTLGYSLTGTDAALFTISATGGVTFNASPDHEAPADANHDNVYNIVVNVNDGVNPTATKAVAITVSDLNDTASVITTAAAQAVVENTTFVAALTSTDADTVGTNPATFTVTGGADAAKFAISNDNLIFAAAPDFEAHASAAGTNAYVVQVTASDGVNTTLKTITVGVTDANDSAPVITTSATQSVAENAAFVAALTSTDADTVGTNPATFTITGGADAAKFAISNGNLVFAAAPDFEAHASAAGTNAYVVRVTASDGVHVTPKTITVGVTDVNEAPTIGGTVAGQTITDHQTVNPFATVTIGDQDVPAQTQSVRVTLDHPDQGAFTAASLASSGFVTNGAVLGEYDFSGTAAVATAAIQALVFQPVMDTTTTPTLTTTFTIAASDGMLSASDNHTTVIVKDVTSPGTPSTPALTQASDSGTSHTDNLTNVSAPTVTGTAEAGSTVTLYDSDGVTVLGQGVATGGFYTITASALSDGVHSLTAHAADAAGNVSAASATLAVTIDTTADAAPLATLAINDTADHIISTSEAAAVAYTVAGLDSDATAVTTFTDGTHSVTANVMADGSFTVDLSALAGSVTSSLAITDTAGNIASATGNAVTINAIHDPGIIDIGLHPGAGVVEAVGDFNHDGTSDVMFRDPGTGTVDEWQLTDGHWQASVDLGAAHGSLDWKMVGAGDFNADGTSDVLWFNQASGQVDEWQMKDGNWSNSLDLGATHGSLDWQIAGIGDFNGDHASDVLWLNNKTGQVDEWQMKDGNWSQSIDLGATHGSTDWKVAGTGDFDGDGTSDVLWFNDKTGQVDEWQMKNGQVAQSFDFGATHGSLDWQIAGIGDADGDGTSDVLWQNSKTGAMDLWKMENGNWVGSFDAGTKPATSQNVGAGDVNNDKTDDVLFHDSVDGHITAGLNMNVTDPHFYDLFG